MSDASGSRHAEVSIDAFDWAATPVGPRSEWPQSLRNVLNLMTDSGFPMVVMWGPELILMYNASSVPMLGAKHPQAMGRPAREVWPEIWETIQPMLEGVLRGGPATFSQDLLLPLRRNGFLEECYFTFSFSPIAEDGTVCGIYCVGVETSRDVIAQRRLRALQALDTRSLHEVTAANPIDIPFSRIYVSDATGNLALTETSGPPPAGTEHWQVDEVARTGRSQVVPCAIDVTATLNEPSRVEAAIVLPLVASGERAAIGAMVVGLSPFSTLDDEYRRFLNLLAARIASETNSARAMETRMDHERVLRVLADAVPQIICTAGSDGKIDYFNGRWFDFTHLGAAQSFEGDGWLQAIHPDDRDAVEAGWRAASQTGEDFSAEARLRSHTGEYYWFLMRAVALLDEGGAVVRLFATATDIDEQKRIEERERFLSNASEVLGSTLETRELLERITELCVPAFADWCQVQSLSADDELVVEAVRHSDPKLNEKLKHLVGRRTVAIADASSGSPQVVRLAQSSVLDNAATRSAVYQNVPDPRHRAVYEQAGLGTALIVPLVARGKAQGTLHLVNVDPASRRSQLTVEIAEELAHRAALAIDNARLYEREHRVASALQRAMLPAHLPAHARIELSYAYRPAEHESRVGGDWYDAFAISEGRIAISIGDVSGHGLEASIAMNEARQALRLSALEGRSPAETLKRANAALMMNDEHPMITAIYGVIDVERSTFEYSCAGHPPPALAPFFGRARYLKGGGIPMGIDLDAVFPSREVELAPYSTLLLYTDGLIEFDRNLDRESTRLLDALSRRVHDTSSDGAGALLRHVLNNRQMDDIAVLAATILPARAELVEITLPASPTSATIARRFVSRYGRVAQLAPERSFDLVIAVGEAVANAVEHAYRGARGNFVLRLDYCDDRIIGEVRDLGKWRDFQPSPERGRGLAILRATTRRFELNSSANGTIVSFAV